MGEIALIAAVVREKRFRFTRARPLNSVNHADPVTR